MRHTQKTQSIETAGHSARHTSSDSEHRVHNSFDIDNYGLFNPNLNRHEDRDNDFEKAIDLEVQTSSQRGSILSSSRQCKCTSFSRFVSQDRLEMNRETSRSIRCARSSQSSRFNDFLMAHQSVSLRDSAEKTNEQGSSHQLEVLSETSSDMDESQFFYAK